MTEEQIIQYRIYHQNDAKKGDSRATNLIRLRIFISIQNNSLYFSNKVVYIINHTKQQTNIFLWKQLKV
jgi:hypothetical protein